MLCNFCDAVLETVGLYEVHLESHHKLNVRDLVCNSLTSDTDISQCSNPLSCNFCSFEGEATKSFSDHMFRKHKIRISKVFNYNKARTRVRTVKPLSEDESASETDSSDTEPEVVQQPVNNPFISDRHENEVTPPALALNESVSSSFKNEFRIKYEAMNNEKKWKLESSNRYVEDEIYKFAQDLPDEHLLHSFTIDNDDPALQCIFSKSEYEELCNTNVKKEIPLDDDTKLCIKALNQTSTTSIRKAISDFSNRRGENFSLTSDFAVDTICYGAESLLKLYECKQNPLARPQHEQWYNLHVWGPLIDKVFLDVEYLDVVRGESCSIASSDRKRGQQRSIDNKERRKVGRKSNAILRTITNRRHLGFGATVAGRLFEGEFASKWELEANLKLPKVLRDMFWTLSDKANWDPTIVENIQTMGYIHGGLAMMVISCDYAKGYVTRVTKSDIYEVAATVDCFSDALLLMTAVWKVKLQAMQTMRKIQSRPFDPTEVELKKRKRRASELSLMQTTSTKPSKLNRVEM